MREVRSRKVFLSDSAAPRFPFYSLALESSSESYFNPHASAPGPVPGAPLLGQGWMIEELKKKLGADSEKLLHELNVTLPQEIRKAVEHGDLKENSEYKAAKERQQFVQARLNSLHDRLSKLSSIDESQIPSDQVGLGSRVVVKDKKTGQKETYNLVFGDALEFEEGHVTMASPIGRALLGKAVGDVASLRLPSGLRQLEVIDLKTIHDIRPDQV